MSFSHPLRDISNLNAKLHLKQDILTKSSYSLVRDVALRMVDVTLEDVSLPMTTSEL